MDLSDYAGVFVLIIVGGIVMLMLAAKTMEKQASIIFFVALIGGFIGIWLCGLLDFADASLETVVTLMLSSLLPASIIVCRWFLQFLAECHERKIQELKISIVKDLEARKSVLCMEKERLEKELLINNSVYNLILLLQICVSVNINFYDNQEMYVDKEKRNELLRNKNVIEKEINSIDSRINELRFNNIYSQLLRIKRGDTE